MREFLNPKFVLGTIRDFINESESRVRHYYLMGSNREPVTWSSFIACYQSGRLPEGKKITIIQLDKKAKEVTTEIVNKVRKLKVPKELEGRFDPNDKDRLATIAASKFYTALNLEPDAVIAFGYKEKLVDGAMKKEEVVIFYLINGLPLQVGLKNFQEIFHQEYPTKFEQLANHFFQ